MLVVAVGLLAFGTFRGKLVRVVSGTSSAETDSAPDPKVMPGA